MGEQFSPDGKWWWNGREWIPAEQAPDQPIESAEGQKGSRWASIRSRAERVAQTAATQAMLAAERAKVERERRSAEAHVRRVAEREQAQARSAEDQRARAAEQATAAEELARIRAACPLPINTERRTLPGGLQLLPGEYLVSTAKHWGFSSDRLALTTNRLLFSHGRLGKEAKQIFLSDIRDVVYKKPMIGTGTLLVEASGTHHNLEGLVHMKRAQQFRNSLLQMVHFARQQSQRVVVQHGPAQQTAQSYSATDRYEQLARLAQLRDQGVLTAEEFAAEKARVLGHS